MIGGIQMFDVPQVLTNRLGTPNRTSMTLIMYLNSYLTPSKNYGMSGAISVMIFIITAILSGIVYKSLVPSDEAKPKPKPHKAHHRKEVKAHEEEPATLPKSAIVSEVPTKTGSVLRIYPPIQKKEGTL
jgi:hypothetical protein